MKKPNIHIKKLIPALEWGTNYKKTQLKGDLSAGLTVGVMLIPQGMAYAMIAGLSPIYGLYASTIPLIIYALLGTSRQLAVGPVAMVSLLTAASIGSMAEAGTETYIALAITLALFVGLIQFAMGAFRLGFLVNFLSHPVISGFTSAAALIIGLSQLKHLLGVDIPRSHHVHDILLNALDKAGDINLYTLAIGIGGIILIKGIKKLKPSIPAPLIAVIFGIISVWGLGLVDQGVSIVGDVPDGLPSMSFPFQDVGTLKVMLPIALTIALVSFMESIAVAKAIQNKHKDYEVDSNQELMALGLANIGGSFFQAYPVTGGFSRTAVNDQAGAKTGMASVISALLIILTLLFLTPLFYYLPKAILASVIMVAVFGLIDYKEVLYLWKTDKTDFWMLIATFVTTLGLGIEEGIGVGVALSLAMVIFRTTRPHVAELGQIPKTHIYRNVERFDSIIEREDVLIVRFDAQLYFANISFFREKVVELARKKGSALKHIIINADSINKMDSSAIHLVENLHEYFQSSGITLYFSGVKGPVRDTMDRARLTEKIGLSKFFLSVQDVMDYIEEERRKNGSASYRNYALQTNN